MSRTTSPPGCCPLCLRPLPEDELEIVEHRKQNLRRGQGIEPLSLRGWILAILIGALFVWPWRPDSPFLAWCIFVGTICAMIVFYFWRLDVIEANDRETAGQLSRLRAAR